MVTANGSRDWQEIVRTKLIQRETAIPREWLLKPGQVPEDRLNVMDVPEKCGILTAREIEITQMDAEVLLPKLLGKELTSYDVNLEMCFNPSGKEFDPRLGHARVLQEGGDRAASRLSFFLPPRPREEDVDDSVIPDQLSHRDLLRSSS